MITGRAHVPRHLADDVLAERAGDAGHADQHRGLHVAHDVEQTDVPRLLEHSSRRRAARGCRNGV